MRQWSHRLRRRLRQPSPTALLLLLLLLADTSAGGTACRHGSGINGNDDVFVDHYVIGGDVMIGAILSIHEHDHFRACGRRLRETGLVCIVVA